MNNGRIGFNNENFNKGSLFTEDEMMFQNNKKSINSIYEENPLQIHFFCKKNIDTLQNLIKGNVYIQSNKRHIIANQDETNLKIIMKSIYLQFGKNLKDDVKHQIMDLNKLVLDYCVPNILSNIEMYLQYKKDITKLPVPINYPKYISDSGTRTNNNLIH